MFCTACSRISLDFISFEFYDLSNRSAPNYLNSADCPVLTNCSLVFPFLYFEGFDLGSLLKVPCFELYNISLCLF